MTGTTPSLSISSQGIQTFGQYSQFLRAAVADEESLQLGESLQAMANQIETIFGLLHREPPDTELLAPALMELLDCIRSHRMLVQELGTQWHGFYEFDAHFTTLTHFRTMVTQWAGDAARTPPRYPTSGELELFGWRTLGAGALLLDVYEQSARKAGGQRQGTSPGNAMAGGWLGAVWAGLLNMLHLRP